ncbi:hypothetical protein IV38_GL000207 [Lactobacillus selangorensis]|uniref:DUF1694 domain-containing protein n=1 Tax=Lactobacillus selangorensis TaxID=81857 RepID=A0A0R2FVN6_9LACO|nr:DUF1694 domain-containing protein [Lactobacillus selangorensis]KRN29324.1 hypothetical protein IV38_GL000207 [Lactobacillus selangorensis]KRN34147.1 hypothetical protein IV40_GL000462 [Lactobacillus selangorensis]
MTEDLNDFLKTRLYGVPQLKPDEKRRFLGNFQERVALAITVSQLRSAKMYALVAQILQRYPEYRIYLNDKLGQHLLNQYLQLAVELNYPFTILHQAKIRIDHPLQEDDFGLVLASPDQKIQRPILI